VQRIRDTVEGLINELRLAAMDAAEEIDLPATFSDAMLEEEAAALLEAWLDALKRIERGEGDAQQIAFEALRLGLAEIGPPAKRISR
jgi:hypothetical protein